MNPLHILLAKSIDYAGLFPPAGLDMASAVSNYADYDSGPDAWALGRFVVPVARLSEFRAALDSLAGPPALPWQLAVLSGPELSPELKTVNGFNAQTGAARIDTIEFRADTVEGIQERMHQVPSRLQAYIEIPIQQDPSQLIGAVRDSGARVKVRTGGVTPDAFPSSADLIRFMSACVRAQVAFKATAGLHHPIRAEYRLTYAPDSDRGMMFGFLNLFVAAAFLRAGMDQTTAAQVLEERSPGAFQLEDNALRWRDQTLDPDHLERARREVMISFGSCSFTEPLTELQSLYLSRVDPA